MDSEYISKSFSKFKKNIDEEFDKMKLQMNDVLQDKVFKLVGKDLYDYSDCHKIEKEQTLFYINVQLSFNVSRLIHKMIYIIVLFRLITQVHLVQQWPSHLISLCCERTI